MDKFLYAIDIFKRPFTMRVDDKMYFSSKVSKSISIYFLVLSLMLVSIYVINFLTQRTFTVISTTSMKETHKMEQIDLKDEMFVITFFFLDGDTHKLIEFKEDYVKESKAVAEILKVDEKGKTYMTIEDKPGAVKCTDESVKDKFSSLTQNINHFEDNAGLHYCFKPEELVNVGGSFNIGNHQGFYTLKQKIDFAKVTKLENKASSGTERRRALKKTDQRQTNAESTTETNQEDTNDLDDLSFLFPADFVRNNYLVVNITYLTKKIDLSIEKGYTIETKSYTNYALDANKIVTDIYLEKTTINSNNEIAFGYPKNGKELFFPIKKIDSNYILDDFRDTIDVDINFELASTEVIIDRNYERVEQMLAGINAIIQVLLISANLTNNMVKEAVLNEFLASKIYTLSPKGNSTLNNADLSRRSGNQASELVKVTKRQSLNRLSLFKTIFPCCVSNSNKDKILFRKAKTYLFHDIDLLTIVKRHLLLEKILKVFLTKYEVQLINMKDVRKLDLTSDSAKIIANSKEEMDSVEVKLRDEENEVTRCILDSLNK